MNYSNTSLNRLPNLTSIRFFLASLVVLFHIPEYCLHRGFPYYNNLPIFQKGTEAVFGFFCLSGFLIIRTLYLEKSKGSINLKKFYWRRIVRIFPLYYLVFCIGFTFYQFIAPKFGYMQSLDYNIGISLLLGLSFFPNILATYAPGGAIEVLWSIGVEEQFYLFIAPILYYLKAKNSLIFLITFTLIYFGVFHFDMLNQYLQAYGMYFFYFSFSGILAYYSIKNQNLGIPIWVSYLCYTLSISLFFSNFIKDHSTPALYNLICMITFSLSIYFLSLRPLKLLENKILFKLGEISYGIYMYHVIIFQLIGFIFIKSNIYKCVSEPVSILLFNFATFTITLLISYFSYHYFEKKFLQLKTY